MIINSLSSNASMIIIVRESTTTAILRIDNVISIPLSGNKYLMDIYRAASPSEKYTINELISIKRNKVNTLFFLTKFTTLHKIDYIEVNFI